MNSDKNEKERRDNALEIIQDKQMRSSSKRMVHLDVDPERLKRFLKGLGM